MPLEKLFYLETKQTNWLVKEVTMMKKVVILVTKNERGFRARYQVILILCLLHLISLKGFFFLWAGCIG